MTASNDFTDFAKRAFAPATRLNALLVSNFERVARFQYELAGDLVQLTVAQMQAAVSAQDLTTLLAQQREIATKFAETATERQQSLARLATESQAGFAQWFEETSSPFTGKAA